MTEDKTEELEIVQPSDFKRNNDRFFICPKCKSRAIALNPKFSKNNITNSLEENSCKEDHIVLICVNCEHTDLLISFLESAYRRFSPFCQPIKISPNSGAYVTPQKTYRGPLQQWKSKI